MDRVLLTEGMFERSQTVGQGFLLSLDVDRLAAPCWEAAGQEAKKPRYGGWESTPISGHSIGHWLSAAAAMYDATGNEALKRKLDYAVDELARIQSLDSEGYVSGFPRACFDQVFTGEFEVEPFSLSGAWVPWYSIHKIYAGLLDVYRITGNGQALDAVTKLADWAKRGTDRLTDEQFQRMLICEHGGMNDALAELYAVTGRAEYLTLAERFCHRAILEPLEAGADELEGKHANTQIPKVIGAARLYELTGREAYKRMALFFWDEVTERRSYIIGGNSIGEHFGPAGQERLGITTTETCNTYNMLKLTEHLYRWSREAAYMDYYERALYNHILASQDPDSGMKTYFVSTQPGHFKVYCSHDDSFWCCTGTGMENPARYARNIYYRDGNDVYVNLFIASELKLEDRAFALRQATAFPEEERTTLIVDEADGGELTLYIRVPEWAAGAVTASINGDEELVGPAGGGYLAIARKWSAGDTVRVHLPMELRLYEAKDDPRKVGFLYGPVVLAGALGTKGFPESDLLGDHLKLNNHPLVDVPTLVAERERLGEWLKPAAGGKPLAFETEAIGQPGSVRLTLIPFYALHHQRYTLYWKLMDEAAYATFEDREQAAFDRLRAITVDEVQPNEQQPEVEHGITSAGSNAGYYNVAQRGWRDSRGEGFFAYRMAVEPDRPMYLLVTYHGRDKAFHADGQFYRREFGIAVDGAVIASPRLDGEAGDGTADVCYAIPRELTAGKTRIEVRFFSEAGKAAGAVYGVRIAREPLD